MTFTVEPDAARRGREDTGGVGGLGADVRVVRARAERRVDMVVRARSMMGVKCWKAEKLIVLLDCLEKESEATMY